MYWSVTYSPRLVWDYALLYVRLQQQGIYIGHCSKPCHMDTQIVLTSQRILETARSYSILL